MSTSIEVTPRTKDRLEELVAEIRTETGRPVREREVLERIVAESDDSRAALIDSFREEFEPASEEEIEEWLSGSSDWGFETTEEEIDDVLYGE